MDTMQIIERECGGWLAIGEAAPGLRIGVTADDETGVRTAFVWEAAKWQALLEKARLRKAHDPAS